MELLNKKRGFHVSLVSVPDGFVLYIETAVGVGYTAHVDLGTEYFNVKCY